MNGLCWCCPHCQGYYWTKRRDSLAQIGYRCLLVKGDHKQGKFIQTSRTGIYAKLKTSPRWCPLKKGAKNG